MVNKKEYTSKDIQVLEPLEAIRKRFGMYVGGKETAAMHLVAEVLDNSVDEFLGGYADSAWVDYDTKTNMITITDNGRGMPIDMFDKDISVLEVLTTRTHAGGKFGDDTATSGLNGIGITAVNALSDHFEVASVRDGKKYSVVFSKGKKVRDFQTEKQPKDITIKSGTIITFRPDKEILGDHSKLKANDIRSTIEERSYINAGMKLSFNGKTYHHPDGIKELLVNTTSNRISDIYHYSKPLDAKGNLYEVVFTYCKDSDERIMSFVNGIRTAKGTHETGFKQGITLAMKNFINDNDILPKKGIKLKDITGDDVRSGIVAIVNVRHAGAEYTSQTKDDLTNADVLGLMNSLTNDQVKQISSKDKNTFKRIGQRIVQFAKGRINASKYKKSIVKNNGSVGIGLLETGKFEDAFSTDRGECELFIIEGDSASGTIKNARNPEFQGLFPLRGKILNTNGMTPDRIVKNVELNNLMVAIFGTNDVNKINVAEDVRFGKIVLTSDADTDGKKN